MTAKYANRQELFWGIFAMTAAFGTYFCMYGFRKPFTATGYDGMDLGGFDYKTVIVSVQVIGYMISKFIGIKVIAEMPPNRRAFMILALIGIAEIGLVIFGLLPAPFNIAGLFLNGLVLGMVFGLVLSFLEGRRLTEALVAGLCASFILADGVTKSVGATLIERGVPELWMPAAAGLVFLLPLLVCVGMLTRVPAPSEADVEARTERDVMTREDRWHFYKQYAPGLTLLVLMFLLVTVMRSVRADFAPEIWAGLGSSTPPQIYTESETWVTLGVMLLGGFPFIFRSNRTAFGISLGVCFSGFLLMVIAIMAQGAGVISPFVFMVLVGLGLYLPYVAVHTTVFERLLAMTHERANLGFLMYVADAFGYLGYVAVMFAANIVQVGDNFLQFFITLCLISSVLSAIALFFGWRYFAAREFHPLEAAEDTVQ